MQGLFSNKSTTNFRFCFGFTSRLCPGTQAKDNWSVVFTIGALVHLFGITFYGIFACGELQDWAEPPVQEKPVWSPSAAAGYTEETSFVSFSFVRFTPLVCPRKRDTNGSQNVCRTKEPNRQFKSTATWAQTMAPPEMHQRIHLRPAPRQWLPNMCSRKPETCTCTARQTIDRIKYFI